MGVAVVAYREIPIAVAKSRPGNATALQNASIYADDMRTMQSPRLLVEPGRDLLFDPAQRLLKHGVFISEADLAEQMLTFLETYNQTAKPFKWTYTGKVQEA
jgi:hypothetical protein